MNLVQRIENDFVAAYKNKAESLVAILRLLKTAVKNRQVELKRPLENGEILDLVLKQIKQRQESIDVFSRAGRHDLAEKEARELELLRAYQPQPLSAEELAALVDATIVQQNAESIKDMGRVIQSVMHSHKGRVDGKAVSELVRARLTR